MRSETSPGWLGQGSTEVLEQRNLEFDFLQPLNDLSGVTPRLRCILGQIDQCHGSGPSISDMEKAMRSLLERASTMC